MRTQKDNPTTKIVSAASDPMTVKTLLTPLRTSAQNLIVDQNIRKPSAPWRDLKVVVVVADAAVKTRSDTDEIETTIQAKEDQQISREREAELKAHEEDLAPRPKRPERRQRGKDSIANQEAKLEVHTVTSGETTIDDAPVLNEGVISETEHPKRARRGRRGSRRENMEVEIPENNVREKVIGQSVQESKTEEPSQSGIAIEVTNSPRQQETSSEDEPRRTSRGRGRPRKKSK